jgi:pimeloyl-ACP methyl ester carboxylesterase
MLTTGLCMIPLAVVLAACSGRRVLALDLPDFEYGWSRSARAARGGAPTSWDEKVAVVGRYMMQLSDAFGGPVDIVGHSYGGYVVEQAAAAYPTAVRKVVSLAPAGAHRYRNYFPAASLASTAFSASRFDPRIPTSIVRNITLTVRAMAQSPSVMRFMLSQRLGKCMAAQAGGIPKETLLIFPDRDNLQMPYFGAQHPLGDAIMMRDVRHGRGLWCTGVSHGLVVEVPCLLADEITSFCGEYTFPGSSKPVATPTSPTWLRFKAVAMAIRATALVSERAARLLPMKPDPALLVQQRQAADSAAGRLLASFGTAYDTGEAGLLWSSPQAAVAGHESKL